MVSWLLGAFHQQSQRQGRGLQHSNKCEAPWGGLCSSRPKETAEKDEPAPIWPKKICLLKNHCKPRAGKRQINKTSRDGEMQPHSKDCAVHLAAGRSTETSQPASRYECSWLQLTTHHRKCRALCKDVLPVVGEGKCSCCRKP